MTTTSSGDPLVGRVLDGRYEILSKLARGGMATVYRAQDRRLTRTVAVKVMHDGLGDDAEFARKFDREARSAATLSNPHVVSVFDQGVDRSRPYIVMEFVQGCTLRHIITREAPLAPLRALDLLESIASALASAHEAGLVHRDVKPENVLISDRHQVKVGDFGLARAVTNQTATAAQGLLIGTVSYLPPELVTSGRADTRSDVYSAGVVLFEMLTGRKPHTGETPIQVAYSHVHSDIPAPSTLLAGTGERPDSRRTIPPYLDALVLACTRREPERRPRDGRELLRLVRIARRALGHGILDDPAITEQMAASMTLEASGQCETPRQLETPGQPGAPGQPAGAAHPSPADEPTEMVALRAAAGQRGAAPVAPRPGAPGPRPTQDSRPTQGSRPGQAPRPAQGSRPAPGPRPDRVQRPGQGGGSTARPPAPRIPRQQPAPGSRLSAGVPRSPSSPARAGALTPQAVRAHRQAVQRRRLVAMIVATVLMLVLLVGGWWYFTAGRYEATPAITQLAQGRAQTLLADAGLAADVRPEYSEELAKGLVTRTEPGPGEKVPRHGTVVLYVSQGPERHAMPTLTGKTKDEAAQALQDASLVLGRVTEQYADRTPVGRVVSASQMAGAKLRRDTAVDIILSKGPRPIDIPNLVGKDSDQARKKLTAAGFGVDVSQQNSDTVPRGAVISQKPSSGTGHRGDRIQLVTSQGPAMTAVPAIDGLTEQAATTALQKAGFQVSVNHVTPGWLRADKVQAVSPGSGSLARTGSTVTLWVI